MNFEMSDDRRMLADTLRRALADGYGFEHRTRGRLRGAVSRPRTVDGADGAWFVLYAFADEDAGGMGGSGFDIAVVFEELGRALVPRTGAARADGDPGGLGAPTTCCRGPPLRRGLR
jgi:alkylation response protein AidB-like acyl-CoA dehydrogenase